MNSKIRIDLTQGIIEAEGPESFVLSVYQDYKQRVGEAPLRSGSGERQGQPPPADTSTKPKKRKAKSSNGATAAAPKGKGKSKESHSIVKDLDLSGGGKKRLKDFFAKYKASGAPQHNLLFVYFMQHNLALKNITADHVYTCYRDVGVKVPGALRQSIFNTGSRNGWLDTSDINNIRLSTHGMNFVEHDFPKAGSEP